MNEGDGLGSSGTEGMLPPEGPQCVASGVVGEVSVASVDKVDLLFVVDNSGSMREEQASLRAQFPRIIEMLTSGMRPDGIATPRAVDLHLGVVSSDMGIVGVEGIERCDGLGDDGIMQNVPSPDVAGCQANYPRFLTYSAGVQDPVQTATDLACIATLGTDGCSFEQQLESGLKALWPSVDADPVTGQPLDQNRILFLPDQNGFGALGHGDTDNAGFLRNDPAAGLSAIAIVVVTDEEDCSSKDTGHFVPAPALDPGDPRVMQDLNLRCFFNPENLYPLERYINGYKALRPGNENLVMFFAIAGVPPDLTQPEEYEQVDWSDDAQRDSFYERIFADPRMQEVIDPGIPAGVGNLIPSCNTDRGKAYPPIRITQVAKGFGANGGVYSICQEDLAPAVDAIVERITAQLGAACLPRPLTRNADGLVEGCDVVWELPPPGQASASTPTRCAELGFDFLLELEDGERTNDRGGVACKVAQLAVVGDGDNRHIVPTEVDDWTYADGWYYDDYSEATATGCTGDRKQRIAFSAGAKPPTGVVVKLECLSELPVVIDQSADHPSCSAGPESASVERVGDPCLPDVVPEGGFQDTEAYLGTAEPDCGGGVCLVYRLRGVVVDGESCVPNGEQECASREDVEQRVYCTCRCDAPEGYAECGCPSGFTCVDVLDQGSDDIRGGYCVRDGTFTR